ncbi:hypothetical protein H8F25_09150 [Synechococcus sp. CBW1004]|nr:hypothetical protein H8F25_09150 [Synechococcus sp. CBW1004]
MHTPVTSALQASQQWLPTGQATLVLGVSADTLKRYAMRDEFLIDGKHWRRGPYRNSPMVWNIPACEEAIRWRVRKRRRA